MRRVLAIVGLIALLFIQTESTFAAGSIRIFKAATGEEGVSSFTIPATAKKSSWPVYIALSQAPSQPVTLSVAHQGKAVFYWTGSDDLTFTKEDWNRRRRLVLEYQGDPDPGEKGRILISAPGYQMRTILFTVEGSSGGGTGGGGTGSGSGTGGGVGGKISNTISAGDLDNLGIFSKLSLDSLVSRAIGLFLLVIALGAFFSIIYSGLQYINSGGDAAKATQARKNILWALVGIIIALMSYAAVRYVATFGTSGQVLEVTDTEQFGDQAGSTTGTNGRAIQVTDASGTSPSVYTVEFGNGVSFPLYVNLGSEITETTDVEVITRGNLPISVSQQKLTFAKDGDLQQLLIVQYDGTGVPGEAAEVVLKTAAGAKYVVRFESRPALGSTAQ